ncbi:DUF853 family protein [Alcaligenaceae bacterium 429]|uniref:helicase HerA-like domain-containing protein n=1 Tax=Paenalcaligenes sp. Me52 TaxID=3392038 RepID=UPI001091AAE2|nr:DUF853 family protein [Alcaligenaceae bacterium 429]
MAETINLARGKAAEVVLLPRMANRHGCITGATGTGKTISLQLMAEAFSRQGTAVFVADVKGDLSGIAMKGESNPKLEARLQELGLPAPEFSANSVVFWDVFGQSGHAIRATVSDMGPMLLARILELNDTQEGILNIAFRLADDEGQLLLDMKDLRAMLNHVTKRATELRAKYGNVSAASVGAIQRALLRLESEGAEQFFGEPALDIADWIRTDAQGKGMVNVLMADRLIQSPRLYSVFLLWMLAELYERLPEVGDLDKPKFVFFFDEAHLLFNEAPKALVEKIEQVVRLVRSKGVGIYFVTQNPLDIPEAVLGQLGHRVQHALRAYTPRDQKAVKTAAQTMRPNQGLDIEAAITELGVGEALVSMLDAKGIPTPTERVWMYAPGSRIGPASDAEKKQILAASLFGLKYDTSIDRESAYEVLTKQEQEASQQAQESTEKSSGVVGMLNDFLFGSTGPRGGRKDGLVQATIKTEARRGATKFLRGVLGSLLRSK